MFIKSLLSALLLVLILPLPVISAGDTIAGYSPEVAMQLGERMYRQGILPSGEPMLAYVQGDIPVDGTMFSCESCHLRSGLGTAEGTIITLPTNGGKLFKPLHRGAEIEVRPTRQQLAKPFQSLDIRPAYTDEKLRNALWAGVDAGGRELSWTMPRYELEPKDMDVLVYYLKNLSTDFSPGVDQDTLTFATVITDDVEPEVRKAYLATLQAYIDDRNSQSRHEERRSRQGPFYRQDRYTAYRMIDLRVWKLTGPAETWPAQLEAYYQEKPVFALLGGISNQSWKPIHNFSERMELPCILPQTPFPVIDQESWYTLYFSKGYYQEGSAAAQYLQPERKQQPPRLVQVVRNRPASLDLATGFAETWRKLGQPTPPTVAIETGTSLNANEWQALAARYPEAIMLVWLPAEDLTGIEAFDGAAAEGEIKFILSGSLLNQQYGLIPESLRNVTLATYPYRLAEDMGPRMRMVGKWLQVRQVPAVDLPMQAKVFFLGWMMTGVMRMMGDDFYRDYFFDVIDMMNDETYAIVNYPRVSFGPAQRYASKGCYLVQVAPGDRVELIPRSPWVIH